MLNLSVCQGLKTFKTTLPHWFEYYDSVAEDLQSYNELFSALPHCVEVLEVHMSAFSGGGHSLVADFSPIDASLASRQSLRKVVFSVRRDVHPVSFAFLNERFPLLDALGRVEVRYQKETNLTASTMLTWAPKLDVLRRFSALNQR